MKMLDPPPMRQNDDGIGLLNAAFANNADIEIMRLLVDVVK
jgi:hypothetical protein